MQFLVTISLKFIIKELWLQLKKTMLFFVLSVRLNKRLLAQRRNISQTEVIITTKRIKAYRNSVCDKLAFAIQRLNRRKNLTQNLLVHWFSTQIYLKTYWSTGSALKFIFADLGGQESML